MREIDGDELTATSTERFVRWQMRPARVTRAWVAAGATIVEHASERWDVPPGSRAFTCLGEAEPLVALMRDLASAIEPPDRLSVPVEVADASPWRQDESWLWRWMYADRPGPEPRVEVVECSDPDEINAVLDAGNPDAWARPGGEGLRWLGIRDGDALVAVGAVHRQAGGAGLLQAVTVVPGARGRGLGRDLSAGLTRLAQSEAPGVATLGAYADNAPAVATYLSLGYANPYTFRSGPVSPAPG
ncbi:GNAT family N-acetyltransferase [Nocardioides sp. LHG3406-4]|uniref:GNAT family N-acetyltransferase n=1 Tax=Nocardioides sp. LHG3406-4 TaxID=2804575 RepID=UPI003CF75581